jgi:acetyl-CoA acetyltransferase
MNDRSRAVVGLMALLACGLIAAGCGDDDETTTTTPVADNAQQEVDSAVQSCVDQAGELGATAAAALEAACTTTGDTVNAALSSGGEDVQQALADAESSCKSAISDLPPGEAQDAFSALCDAIASAE